MTTETEAWEAVYSHEPAEHSEPLVGDLRVLLRKWRSAFGDATGEALLDARQLRRELWNARAGGVVGNLNQGHRARFECSDYTRLAEAPGLSEWIDRAPELGGSESYSSCKEDDDGRYWVPDYLGFSDYSGYIVERSNFRAFCQQFGAWDGLDETAEPIPDFAVELYGGHGTRAIALHIRSTPADAWEFLAALEDYPLADDELHSAMETEGQTEAWESWARKDFEGELEKLHPEWDLDDVCDEQPGQDALWRVFYEASEDANEYWQCETGGDMWISLKRVAAAVTSEQVGKLPAVRRVSKCANEDEADATLARARDLAKQSRDSATQEQRETIASEARAEMREFVFYCQENDDYVPE